MRRRQYLATVSAGVLSGLAGCNTTSSTPQTATQTTTAATTNTATTTEATRLEPEIAFNAQGLNDNSAGGVPNIQAEAIVGNQGETGLVNVEVRARWYNEKGYLLGDDTNLLQILPAGDEWYTWVFPFSVSKDAVADVELSWSVGGYWPGSTQGVVIEDSRMYEADVPGEDPQNAYFVEGLATNDTGRMADLSIIALLRTNNGVVVYSNSVAQSLVPAGDTWTWDMGWQVLVRWPLVEDYTLYVQAG